MRSPYLSLSVDDVEKGVFRIAFVILQSSCKIRPCRFLKDGDLDIRRDAQPVQHLAQARPDGVEGVVLHFADFGPGQQSTFGVPAEILLHGADFVKGDQVGVNNTSCESSLVHHSVSDCLDDRSA